MKESNSPECFTICIVSAKCVDACYWAVHVRRSFLFSSSGTQGHIKASWGCWQGVGQCEGTGGSLLHVVVCKAIYQYQLWVCEHIAPPDNLLHMWPATLPFGPRPSLIKEIFCSGFGWCWGGGTEGAFSQFSEGQPTVKEHRGMFALVNII